MTPTINLLSLASIDQIVQIDKEANLTAWSKFDYQGSFSNPNHSIFGLFLKDKLIGFCAISLIIDEVEILQFVIDIQYQKHGYGYLLLKEVIDRLEQDKVQQIFLEVRVGNDSAIRLYEKLGFNIVGKRKSYYTINGQKHDALLMARTNVDIFNS